MDLLEIVSKVAIYFIPFLFSLCFHEYAHAWVARRLGDSTAEDQGRLSMNPMVHAHPIGTFLLPMMVIVTNVPIFFGWAKPVPVDPRNLRNVKTDMFWIAIAGPLSNVLLAFLGAFALVSVFHYLPDWKMQSAALEFLKVFVPLNLALAFFNMIPIHPLDGGKVLARFLPEDINRKLEENQYILSIALLFLFIGGFLAILRYPIFWGYEFLIRLAEGVLV